MASTTGDQPAKRGSLDECEGSAGQEHHHGPCPARTQPGRPRPGRATWGHGVRAQRDHHPGQSGKLMKKISPLGSSGDEVAADERRGGDSDPAQARPGADRPAGVGGPELRQPDRQASRGGGRRRSSAVRGARRGACRCLPRARTPGRAGRSAPSAGRRGVARRSRSGARRWAGVVSGPRRRRRFWGRRGHACTRRGEPCAGRRGPEHRLRFEAALAAAPAVGEQVGVERFEVVRR